MATGAYVYRDAYYGQRLILTLSRSGNTVSYAVSLQSTGSMYGTWSVTLTGGISRTVSYTISQGSGFTQQIASGSFTSSSATTVHASSKMFWGGTATVSASITAAGSVPGTPTNLRLSVRDTSAPQSFTLAWNAVSGATSYIIQASENGGSWYDMATSTTTSKQVVYGSLNIQRRFRVRAKNSIGTGAASAEFGPVYGQQSAPVIVDMSGPLTAIDLKLTSKAKYTTGWEVELDTPAATETFASTSLTLRITQTVNALTKFRVRGYAGDGSNRGYTAWSAWSEAAFYGAYSAPEITFIDVKRCTSAGVLNEQGQYVKVMSKGTASSVKQGTTETNKVTRQIHYRQLGASAWTLAATLANGINAANWDESTGVTTGGNNILPVSSYEVRYRVSDTYTPVAYEKIVVVPTSLVAFSIGPEGIGAGKVWEQGALDVGVGGMHGPIATRSFTTAGRDPAFYSTSTMMWVERATENGLVTPIRAGNHYGMLVTQRSVLPTSSYPGLQQIFTCSACDNIWKRVTSNNADWAKWTLVSSGDPNVIVIDEVAYQRSGVASVPDYTLVGTAPLYYRILTVALPYVPPDGWGFSVTPGIGGSVPLTMFQLNWGANGTVDIMVQCVRSDGRISSLAWQLVKI